MKKQLLLISSIIISSIFGLNYAQDCSGNRYQDSLFAVDVQKDIKYGENYNQDSSQIVELYVDVYTPSGDVATDRPLILLAHGGSFIGGSKENMDTLCKRFASMGYVAATMQYRLLALDASVFADLGGEFKKEVVRAIHDMKAAIRFFRKAAIDGGNPYGINPDIIVVGGMSAGAILANHVTYLNEESEVPSDLVAYLQGQGGLEGKSGNPGYSSTPQLSISWCGAIMDTSWMHAGDQPYVGVHNLGDQTVPNLSGQPNVGIAVPVNLMGDSLMYVRAQNEGIPSTYLSVPGNAHCDFPPQGYTIVFDFVHDQICNQSLAVNENKKTVDLTIYPNPASTSLTIEIPSNKWNWNLSILNMLGQEVYSDQFTDLHTNKTINTSSLKAGIYTVLLTTKTGKSAIKKVIIR